MARGFLLLYAYLLHTRILSLCLSNSAGPVEFGVMKVFADAYPAAYQTFYKAKPITCSVTGTTFDAIPAPCAVILDVSQPMYYEVNMNTDCLFLLVLSSSLPFLN